jgi:hypothetical protein
MARARNVEWLVTVRIQCTVIPVEIIKSFQWVNIPHVFN